MLPQNSLNRVTNSVFDPLESNSIKMIYQLQGVVFHDPLHELKPWHLKALEPTLKVCDDGDILHLGLLSFCNLPVI